MDEAAGTLAGQPGKTTTTLSLVTYHYLARATFIGAQLNGTKHPRVAPWRQAVAAQPGGAPESTVITSSASAQEGNRHASGTGNS